MSNIVIKVENLSKQYRLGEVGTGSMRDDFKRFRYRIMGKEDPFLTIGEENNRNTKSQSDYVWALKDINFEVKKGDVVGIIGRNGAGKSTLLKILSRTTGPTTGSVKMQGRIASLLEVGTGFHGELTGRENIFLNGAIMGLRKYEISAKLEEIIDFAGVERYIDTPVKRYSSGMYVRLAFAVAAHLEPDIMIIDEVLAVGDAEFQKKALGKINHVSKNEGRTVLFVSHSMDAVMRLCSHAILLKNGSIQTVGKTINIIDNYLQSDFGTTSRRKWDLSKSPGNDIVRLLEVICHDTKYNSNETFDVAEEIGITIKYEILKSGYKLSSAVNFFNANGINIFDSHESSGELYKENRQLGNYQSIVWIPSNLLSEGTILIGAAIVTHDPFVIHLHELDVVAFTVVDKVIQNLTRGDYVGSIPGLVRPLLKWETVKIK
jgi:lipopolysaccharide transport system ATP-binding protein